MGQAQSGQGGFPGQGPPGGEKKDQAYFSSFINQELWSKHSGSEDEACNLKYRKNRASQANASAERSSAGGCRVWRVFPTGCQKLSQNRGCDIQQDTACCAHNVIFLISQEKKKKWEPPAAPARVGRKQKRRDKGSSLGTKLPTITPNAKCKLRLLKLERVKDWLLMEEEFVQNQERLKPQEEKNEEERTKVRICCSCFLVVRCRSWHPREKSYCW